MTKKYYGVKVGKLPGIYTTWDECKKQVTGYPGALYKGFPTENEAREYIAGSSAGQPSCAPPLTPPASGYNIYVDGSYKNSRYSWAFVVYDGPTVIHEEGGAGESAEAAVIRNVAGELEATVNAVKWAEKEGIQPITIHHDYIGISEWAVGSWKTNNPITEGYARYIKQRLDWIRFHKVPGHAGIEGNERADKLAGQALENAEA